MKVVSVVGARPQLVKLAPVAAAFAKTDHRHVIVHTGQHYDADLSDVFFAGLGIPEPDVHLGVGSASHGVQTGKALAALDPVLAAERPDWVLVYGDTNSTLAGALSAVKQHLPVAHLEAGLRSFNRRMPEEHNRVLTDHAADLLLAPTEEAMRHLAAEGLADRAELAGDVMVDVCLRVRDAVLAGEHPPPTLPDGIRPDAPYLLATLHRAENTDDSELLAAIVDAFANLPVPLALLAHPRLVAKAEEHGVKLARGAVHVGPAAAVRGDGGRRVGLGRGRDRLRRSAKGGVSAGPHVHHRPARDRMAGDPGRRVEPSRARPGEDWPVRLDRDRHPPRAGHPPRQPVR